MNIKQCLADAASYWERKRLIYNAVLAILALVCWGPDIVMGGPRDWLGGTLVLLGFAVFANILFTFAYPIDIVFQITPLKAVWARSRWLLFTSGLILASMLALVVMLGDGMA